jgi:hypothetical protein
MPAPTPSEFLSDQTASSAPSPSAFVDQANQPQPDVFEKLVNYHTGNNYIDAPMGVLQGAAKGAASTGVGIASIARKLAGLPPLPDDTYKLDTVPEGIGQGTGKFLEQAAEFGIPAAKVGAAVKGAGFLTRAGAQALTGAGVAGAQSGGDPLTTAVGGLLGAGGETLSGIKALAKLPKAATPENYSNAFAAVPSQRPVIGKAIPTLVRDKILPGETVHDTQEAIKGQLAKLGKQYDALPPDYAKRSEDALNVMQQLQDAQGKLVSENGHVLSENKGAYDLLDKQIKDVAAVADQKTGQVSFKALKQLRDAANGKTNFQSPEADQNLYRTVGDIYRSGMDRIVPATSPLNRDYAVYKGLENIIDTNVGMGRGVMKSGLDKVADRATDRAVGEALGGMAGHMTHIPGAEFIGAMMGGAAYPKLTRPIYDALKNASESGAFDRMAAPTKAALKAALQSGNEQGVISILGRGTSRKIVTSAVNPAE